MFFFCYSSCTNTPDFSRNILLPSSVEVLLDHISLIRDSNPLVVYFSTAGQIYTDSPHASSLNTHSEDSPVQPTSLYGLHKYTEELIFRERSHKNFDLKILRLSNVIGPDFRSSNPLCPTFKGFNSLLFSLFARGNNRSLLFPFWS